MYAIEPDLQEDIFMIQIQNEVGYILFCHTGTVDTKQ